jgi:hypothetical protein
MQLWVLGAAGIAAAREAFDLLMHFHYVYLGHVGQKGGPGFVAAAGERFKCLVVVWCVCMIEQELGQPIDVVFSEFSDKPIAAASLAQVGAWHATPQAVRLLE